MIILVAEQEKGLAILLDGGDLFWGDEFGLPTPKMVADGCPWQLGLSDGASPSLQNPHENLATSEQGG